MKLSIITINYNNREGLGKTITSVLNQTYKDFEYIIVDGSSNDGSVDLIKENEHALTYWVSEKDKGIFNAMNKGLAVAMGTYCLFLNSGDYLVNDNILEQVDPFLKEDIVYGDVFFIYPDKRIHRAVHEAEIDLYKLSFTNIPHQGSFIKRSLLIKNGGYKEEFKIASDWIFLVQSIVECNASFKKMDIVVSYFDKSGISSVTSSGHENTKALATFYPFLLSQFKSNYELRYYQLSRAHQALKKILTFIKRN